VDRAQAVGEGGRGTIFPDANYQRDQAEAQDQSCERNDVGRAVEALGSGSRENRWSVFLDEALLDQTVAVSAVEGCQKLVAHAVGGGAADVVAFQKNLIAAADAHHLMADFVKARGGIAGTEEREDSGAQQEGLGELTAVPRRSS